MSNGEQRAFLWSPGSGNASDLGVLPYAGDFEYNMEATAISDTGIVVGNSSVREGGFGPNSHAFVYSGGHFIDINGDGGFTLARDVNDFGNVVGAGLWKDQVPALAAGFWVPGAPALKPINQNSQ